MKLLLRHDQKTTGMISHSVTFTLDARAELTGEEAENVKKYKMGKTILYTNFEEDKTSVVRSLARVATAIRVTIDSLIEGQHFEGKDIIEMIDIEERIKEACKNFKLVLDTAAQFGGEEIIEY